MTDVYLGLGSNIEPEKHLRLGIQALGSAFGLLELSNVYRSAALGFDGDEFMNLVVGLKTDEDPLAIHALIEGIHTLAGRQRGESRYAPRSLDIDLLLYGDLIRHEPPICVPRSDILEYSFVLGPLAEIAPTLRHPETGRQISEHWAEYDKGRHPLTATDVMLVSNGSPHA